MDLNHVATTRLVNYVSSKKTKKYNRNQVHSIINILFDEIKKDFLNNKTSTFHNAISFRLRQAIFKTKLGLFKFKHFYLKTFFSKKLSNFLINHLDYDKTFLEEGENKYLKFDDPVEE